jgi:DNA-binding CsgD family transcriptional regulator
MDQLWLGISLFGFLSGAALFGALLLLSRLSGLRTPALLIVVSAFMLMGAASLAGVYLRILELPRTVPAYRLLNSLAWAYALYGVLLFLHVRSSSKTAAGLPGSPRNVLPPVLLFLLLVLLGPLSGESRLVPGPPFSTVLMVLVIAALALLCLRAGQTALREARNTASLPLRRMLTGLGIALIVLPTAELADFIVTAVLNAKDIVWYDGFLFSCGYAAANVALLAGLISSFSAERTSARAGRNDAATAVPASFITVFALTRREAEIVAGLLLGRSDREIAEELYISPRTVDTHLRNIFRKCGVSTRMQLARLVADYGVFRS